MVSISLTFYFCKQYKHKYFFTGNNILNLDVQQDMLYKKKLKGISICFSMLKAALCGNYVNFGVFKLYGDDTLENALNIFVKLLLSIPLSDLMVSLKLFALILNYISIVKLKFVLVTV